MTTDFTPTRAAGLDRLAAFVPYAGMAYAAQRNYDLGPGQHTHVSCLSPYLRCRMLTEQEVIEAVIHHHGPAASDKFVQEVFWRTYWKGWLELRPQIWNDYQTSLAQAWNDVQTQAGLRARWEAACRGETDIDCMNAWAKELVGTGYLHNHARMWFASIWIFTLRLPWELGADFFLRHLLDGDPASNTLSWRWVAGIQTPGKTYLARTSNITKFTEGRFHPKWQLASEAPPLAATPLPDPRPLPDNPTVDANLRTGLLLHEDDMSPDFAQTAPAPQAQAILAPQAQIGPLIMAESVTGFRAEALKDAGKRLPPARVLATQQDVLDWARAENIEQIIAPYAPTGPVRTLLDAVSNAHADLRICQMMRPYDRAAWPHATHGFFRFRKQIPHLISQFNRGPKA